MFTSKTGSDQTHAQINNICNRKSNEIHWHHKNTITQIKKSLKQRFATILESWKEITKDLDNSVERNIFIILQEVKKPEKEKKIKYLEKNKKTDKNGERKVWARVGCNW